MKLPAIIGHSAELCRIIRKSRQADDAVTSQYLRSKKYIGSRDRKAISGIVFATLRLLGYCERVAKEVTAIHQIAEEQHGRLHCLIALMVTREVHEAVSNIVGSEVKPETIAAELKEDALGTVFASVVDILGDEHTFEAGDVLPTWLEADIEASGNQNLTSQSRSRYAASAPLCLRIVRPMQNTTEVEQFLRENDIDFRRGAYANHCIVLPQRVNLRESPIVRNGLVEIQDEASQLFAEVLQPTSGMRVLDACAGAGGKSLHIADIMHYEGELVASDIDYRRLKRMIPRLRTIGAKLVKLHRFEKSVAPAEQFNGLFDAVVVDAPCSGLGTVRRSPMIKWRSSSELVGKFHKRQVELLHQYAPLVAPGGILLYATCSIHSMENHAVVDAFLQQHPEFEVYADLYPKSVEATIQNTKAGHEVVQMYPHVHGTDGFFICKFVKNG